MTDPLSLTETRRLAGTADTILLRATRTADLETPIGAFLRLDDGVTPAYLLESVEGGERLGRYSFLGIGPRRLLEVRGGKAHVTTRPVGVEAYSPDLPVTVSDAADPLEALRRSSRSGGSSRRRDAALHRRRGRRPQLRRDHGLRAVRAAARPRPRQRAARELHRDGPRDRVRPPHPPAERDRVAAYRDARPRGPLPDRRAGDLRGAGADRPPEPGRDDGGVRAFHRRRRRNRRVAARAGRDEPRPRRVHPRRRACQGRDRGRRGDPGRPRAAAELRPAGYPDGAPIDGIGLYRALRRVNPSPYLFFTRTPEMEVVGASPELLVQVAGDRMSTHPIAGTRPRGTTPADDDRLADELRNDPKERAEHVMLVDLGRNDLGRVAQPGTVTTSQYMEVERYSHVLHLVSHVEAKLRAGAGRARRAPLGVPRGHADGRPEDPRDAADRRCRGRTARAVWWRVGYLGYDGNLDTAITIRSPS